MPIAISQYQNCPPLFDWCWLDDQLDDLIADNPTSIVIRRDTKGGDTSLTPQTVRIARAGNARGRAERNDDRTKDVHSPVVVVGYDTLDIQPDDRFTYENELYRVVNVRPHGSTGTINCKAHVRAEADKVS